MIIQLCSFQIYIGSCEILRKFSIKAGKSEIGDLSIVKDWRMGNYRKFSIKAGKSEIGDLFLKYP
jgi:hypothetical protein